MVVDDFDTVRFSVFEHEAYTPLHVYGNRMLTGAVASEGVEPIGRWDAQVVERICAVKQGQLCERALLDIGRQLGAAATVPDVLGFLAGEGVDHEDSSRIISSLRYSVSFGRSASQNRSPFTFVPVTAVAAADGLSKVLPSGCSHWPR